jgi:predicted aspartyl protease
MISGWVHSGEAIVPLRLRGPIGDVVPVEAVLDTGFNDWLTLSSEQIAAMRLTFREKGYYILADGSEVVSRVFEAEVHWISGWRRILVVEMDGGSLLGMAMLAGYRVELEVIRNGRVEISPLY